MGGRNRAEPGRFLPALPRGGVAAIEGVAAHIVGPVTPDGERVVPRRHDPPPAPEGQKRAGDPARPLIGGVVFAIEGGGGAVLLADGVDGRGIAEGPQIFGAHRRGEGPRHGRPAIEHVVEDELRLGPDQALGDWMRRGEEGPDPVVEREGGVGATERLPGRDDVEDGQLAHRLGVIEREAIGAASPRSWPATSNRVKPSSRITAT